MASGAYELGNHYLEKMKFNNDIDTLLINDKVVHFRDFFFLNQLFICFSPTISSRKRKESTAATSKSSETNLADAKRRKKKKQRKKGGKTQRETKKRNCMENTQEVEEKEKKRRKGWRWRRSKRKWL